MVRAAVVASLCLAVFRCVERKVVTIVLVDLDMASLPRRCWSSLIDVRIQMTTICWCLQRRLWKYNIDVKIA